MANKIYQLVSVSEQETIIQTLLDLINSFPDLPTTIKTKGIMYYDMYPDLECLGLATTGSAIKYQSFIGGSYIGQYNFRLHYRYSTKNYKERLAKQSLISTIGEWLQGYEIQREDGTKYQLNNYPEISKNKSIESIEITNRTVLVDKNKTGYEDSIIDSILKYHVRKV